MECGSISRDPASESRAVARALIGGGGCIFIYSSSARLVSFEIKLISKEVSRAEPEYMNTYPSISVLATTLSESIADIERVFSFGPVRPKLDFPRSIFGGKSVRFQEKWYDLYDWVNIKYRKTQCFVSIVGCLGLKISNLYMLQVMFQIINYILGIIHILV